MQDIIIKSEITKIKEALSYIQKEKQGRDVNSRGFLYLFTEELNLEARLNKLELLLLPKISFESLQIAIKEDAYFDSIKTVLKGQYLILKKGNAHIAKIQILPSQNAFKELKRDSLTLHSQASLLEKLKSDKFTYSI